MNYETAENLEDFFTAPANILRTKLEVMVLEIAERLRIKSDNSKLLFAEQGHLDLVIARMRYRPDEEKAPFYREMFAARRELRAQQVEAWRDIAMMMRDLLNVWELYEKTKVKRRLLSQ